MTQAQAKYLKDYAAPTFTITHLDLSVNLAGKDTQVIATSKVVRRDQQATSLVLDGDEMNVLSVRLNGESVSYKQGLTSLSIDTRL